MNTRSSKDNVLLKFMQLTIDNVNTCLAGQHALFKILIEKKVISEAELISYMRESKKLPDTKRGASFLKDIMEPDWLQEVDLDKSMDNLLESKKQEIFNKKLPEHWLKEGVEPPNLTARENAYKSCKKIFEINALLPDSIACTKENGIFLSYRKGLFSLYIETYNDGDIGALLVKDKSILFNENIIDFNFEEVLTEFNKKGV